MLSIKEINENIDLLFPGFDRRPTSLNVQVLGTGVRSKDFLNLEQMFVQGWSFYGNANIEAMPSGNMTFEGNTVLGNSNKIVRLVHFDTLALAINSFMTFEGYLIREE